MKILIIGAGAVAQVYAHYLQQGGAKISFYVKEKYADDMQNDLKLYQYSVIRFLPVKKLSISGYDYFTDFSEIKKTKFDVVLLTLSSTAVRAMNLQEFVDAIGDTAVVATQPSLKDRQYLERVISKKQIISAMIGFISFQSPLPGLDQAKGVHCLLPKTPSLFAESGHPKLKNLLKTLSRAGFKAKKLSNLEAFTANSNAASIPFIAALEVEGWSFSSLSKGEVIALMIQAIKQSTLISSRYFGAKPHFLLKFLSPLMVKILLLLMSIIFPFSMESFFKYHFTKVGEQTELVLQDIIDAGLAMKLETTAIQELLAKLRNVRKQSPN